jgi:hypothetical protein
VSPENSFIHIIPAKEVEDERQKIVSALIHGGYDPQGLDLFYPAAQRKVAEICDEALERDIPMADPNWVLNEESAVEVTLAFRSVSEMVLIKLAIT